MWEWQSETYVLKQQGHFYDMNVLSYSPDGQIIATGGDDGKVGCLVAGQKVVSVSSKRTRMHACTHTHTHTHTHTPQVKLWNTSSGFCFVTFTDHSSGICGVTFSASGKVVVSSSLDGTVRAFDLHRWVGQPMLVSGCGRLCW